MAPTRLYVGTEEGLVVLRSTKGGWEEVNRGVAFGHSWRISGAQDRPEQVYMAVQLDGLYRTDDAGKTWTRVLEGDVRSVTVDPTDQNVVYAGTEPVSILRSTDRGNSWQELTGVQDFPDEIKAKWWFPTPPHQGHVLNIFVHPDNPRIIYVCLEHGGIIRSLDRGETWEDVSAGIDYVDMHAISSLPHDLNRYYTSSARGFFTSEDPADGWMRAENGCTRDYFHDFFFMHPKKAGEQPTMLIATANGSPGFWDRPEHARAAVFRSKDAAQSWQRVGVGAGLPDELGPGIWALVGCANDPDVTFVGTGWHDSRKFPKQGPGTIYRTPDRGDSWDELDVDVPNVRAIWAAPD